jgi:methyl-accepting chemotaxis protein
MTIRQKMMAGFASVSLLLGVVGGVSFYYARQANDAYIDLLQYYAVRANVKDIAKNILRQSNSLRDYLLDPGDDSFEDLQQDNSNLSALIDKTIAMDNMQDEQGFLQKLKELNQELMKKSDWVVASRSLCMEVVRIFSGTLNNRVFLMF